MRFASRFSAGVYLNQFGYSYSLPWGWSKIHRNRLGRIRRIVILEQDNHKTLPWKVTYYDRSAEE